MTEPKSFKDILELQEIHEIEVNKPREDGFVAREKKYHDLRGALMDEFMEFRRELPYELNFKTWKKKRYSAVKQLEEFVDMLFFIATEINFSKLKRSASDEWEALGEGIRISQYSLLDSIIQTKEGIFRLNVRKGIPHEETEKDFLHIEELKNKLIKLRKKEISLDISIED